MIKQSRAAQPSEILDRCPPQNLDAERQVLGSILLDPSRIDDLEWLRPEDFYADAHSRLYRAMQAMTDSGRKLDASLLLDYLQRGGELEQIGGHAYLAEIVQSVPVAAHAVHYAEQVVDAVLVGNTAMHHLMLGLPARSLGEAPYVPVVSAAMDVQAQEFGLQLSAGAHVYIPPNIAGYVGADHVAMVLASEMWASDQPVLALDIGTNTEIALAYGERLLCCSTASGPVFEGAHIQDGMRAAPGAIERVRWLEGKLHIQTIDNLPAVGICGSGILDAVAALLSTGAIEASGKLKRDHPLVDRDGREPGVVLATSSASGHGREVRVTRRDIHEIQLAKGAIRAGVELLLREAGLAADDLDQIVVAGAFGTYLDIPSAIQVGMFPDLPVDRIHQVGNAAGVGARQMIVSAQRRKQAEEIARRMEYIELTTHPGFTPEFIQQMYF